MRAATHFSMKLLVYSIVTDLLYFQFSEMEALDDALGGPKCKSACF